MTIQSKKWFENLKFFRSKILVISYIEFYHTIDWVNFEKLFAWVSNVDEINWIVLEVKNPPIYYVGNLVLYKGIY